jgi:hypothetical protein
MKMEEEGFAQAFIFVWEPNPNKDSVRVSLDDGAIRLILKRQKFTDLMLSIMNIDIPEISYNFFRIKESLRSYGGHYLYDRATNTFRELQERPQLEHIHPRDLIDEARRNMPQLQHDSDQFLGLAKFQEKAQAVHSPQPRSLRGGNFIGSFIRSFTKRKK